MALRPTVLGPNSAEASFEQVPFASAQSRREARQYLDRVKAQETQRGRSLALRTLEDLALQESDLIAEGQEIRDAMDLLAKQLKNGAIPYAEANDLFGQLSREVDLMESRKAEIFAMEAKHQAHYDKPIERVDDLRMRFNDLLDFPW